MLLRVENRLKGEKEKEKEEGKEAGNVVRSRRKKQEEEIPDELPPSRWETVKAFLQSENFRKISAVALVLFSLYLFVAFVSHFFTRNYDQSIAESGMLGNPDREIPTNWTGSIGAWFAWRFITMGFGFTSLLIPVFLGIVGVALLEKRFYNLAWDAFRHFFFFGVWGSLLLGYIAILFSGSSGDAGGAFGGYVNESMFYYINKFGMAVMILLGGIGYVVFQFNVDLRPVEWLSRKKKEAGESLGTVIATEGDEAEVPPAEEETGEITLVSDPPKKEKKKKPAEEEKTETPLVLEVADEEVQPAELELKVEEKLEVPAPWETAVPAPEPVAIAAEDPLALEITTTPEEKIDDNIYRTQTDTYEKIVPEEDVEALEEDEDVGDWEQYDPTKDLSDYQFPTLELLKNYDPGGSREVNRNELEENKNKIVRTLKNYNIEITQIKATVGPTVTLYEIVPAPGVRISKIKNLEDDIALSLAALGIRIIAPIPGKGTIGIEIPNSNPETVSMRSVLSTEKFRDTKAELPLALGRTISNEVFIGDLSKMPHLLVAGATGQGKSVGINGLITSILYKKHPSQVKFVLIDPKKVELNLYAALEKHFLAKLPGLEDSIITDTKQVIHVLNSLCVEMDDRYDLLKRAKVRNLREYNEKFLNRRLNPKKGHRFLPYIVLIIDEFADLMMTAGKEIETPIARLAQLARAIGIHLVLATQRPSVNVITGIIKANFPARISYRVTSKVDSRTILDTGGADQLIGRGDLLLSSGSDLIRIQNAFVDTPEVEHIVNFISEQRGYPQAYQLPEIPMSEDGDNDDDDDSEMGERDPMFAEAARLVVRHQQGSTSLIQRRMKLGYNRAGRIMDQLEKAGIVGAFSGSKARDVLVRDEVQLEQYLNSMG